jgi:predicted transcriptional regulator
MSLLSGTKNEKIFKDLKTCLYIASISVSIMRKLVRWRKKRGWSQRLLGEKSGISHITIARLELNQFDPRLSTLRALAKALKVKIADLVD